MLQKIIILALGIFTLGTCNAQTKKKCTKKTTKIVKKKATTASKTEKLEDGLYYLNEGETKFFEKEQMNVSFKNVVEDSRCPTGVNCIWQGIGVVELQFMGTYTRPVLGQLSTGNAPGKANSQYFKFNGYTIILQNLTPHPTQNAGFDENKGKYKVAFKVVKGDVNDPRDAKTTTQ